MASKVFKTTAILLTLSILFFSLVNSQAVPEASCPIDGLNFGACVGMLHNLVNGVILGTPQTLPCCSLFTGLANFESASCLCKAIKTNFMGVGLDATPSLSLALKNCGKDVPLGFKC